MVRVKLAAAGRSKFLEGGRGLLCWGVKRGTEKIRSSRDGLWKQDNSGCRDRNVGVGLTA